MDAQGTNGPDSCRNLRVNPGATWFPAPVSIKKMDPSMSNVNPKVCLDRLYHQVSFPDTNPFRGIFLNTSIPGKKWWWIPITPESSPSLTAGRFRVRLTWTAFLLYLKWGLSRCSRGYCRVTEQYSVGGGVGKGTFVLNNITMIKCYCTRNIKLSVKSIITNVCSCIAFQV